MIYKTNVTEGYQKMRHAIFVHRRQIQSAICALFVPYTVEQATARYQLIGTDQTALIFRKWLEFLNANFQKQTDHQLDRAGDEQ